MGKWITSRRPPLRPPCVLELAPYSERPPMRSASPERRRKNKTRDLQTSKRGFRVHDSLLGCKFYRPGSNLKGAMFEYAPNSTSCWNIRARPQVLDNPYNIRPHRALLR